MLESKSQAEMLRLLCAVCPGGWFGYMMSSLCALEVGRHGSCQIFYKVCYGIHDVFFSEQVQNTSFALHGMTSETQRQ